MERRRLTFSGRVQGVGFRATARHLAADRPVSGWVRNEPDGTVTLEIQASAPELEAYLDRLRGSLGRNIRHESVINLSAVPGETTFIVSR